MRRLREARGTRPTHKTVELTNVPGRQFQVEILDDSGVRIGEHRLSFKLQDVKCMRIDSVQGRSAFGESRRSPPYCFRLILADHADLAFFQGHQ